MGRYRLSDSESLNSVLSEIDKLDEKKGLIDQLRQAQIKELLLAAAYEGKETERVLLTIAALKCVGNYTADNVDERVFLCKSFISLFKDANAHKREFLNRSGTEVGDMSACLLENRYGELALKNFSQLIPLKAVIAQSFEDICDNILEGVCDYGIIPTESSDNGKLIRFYSLIDRYDLKIIAVTDIEHSDNSSSTRYALIGKNVEFPNNIFGAPDYLEFSIKLDSPELLEFIIRAAKLCGMKLSRIDSIPIAYREREFSFCPVFSVQGANIDAFLLYMQLDFPQYAPIGIFPKV